MKEFIIPALTRAGMNIKQNPEFVSTKLEDSKKQKSMPNTIAFCLFNNRNKSPKYVAFKQGNSFSFGVYFHFHLPKPWQRSEWRLSVCFIQS